MSGELAIAREALREIAEQGDRVVTAWDGYPSVVAVDREVERVADIARDALDKMEGRI